MPPTVVSGIVPGDAPVSYWLIFFPALSNNPRSLCESLLVPVSFILVSNVANSKCREFL